MKTLYFTKFYKIYITYIFQCDASGIPVANVACSGVECVKVVSWDLAYALETNNRVTIQ